LESVPTKGSGVDVKERRGEEGVRTEVERKGGCREKGWGSPRQHTLDKGGDWKCSECLSGAITLSDCQEGAKREKGRAAEKNNRGESEGVFLKETLRLFANPGADGDRVDGG